MQKKFLVLGDKGYLGNPMCKELISNGNFLQIFEGHLHEQSNFNFLEDTSYENSCILNFIAKGVNSLQNQKNLAFVNGLILEKLLDGFLRSKAKFFIHFASHYELKSKSDILPARLPYVNSKSMGSNICKMFMRKDERVKLIYLPTIISMNYSKGRFFSDFIRASITGEIFRINDPASKIQVSTFDNMFSNVNRFLDSSESNLQIQGEINCSVLEFANLINEILGQLGFDKVLIEIAKHNYKSHKSVFRTEISDSCILRMREYVLNIGESV